MAKKQAHQNTLWTNDNLFVLSGMNSESVDLIYLDPPFNSKRMYSAPLGSKSAGASFKDMWTWQDVNEGHLERMVNEYPYLVQYVKSLEGVHSKAMMAYVTYMAQRIIEMHRVLKATGSLYFHCDATAAHYIKPVLDQVFSRDNFVRQIIWRIGWVSGYKSAAKNWARNHDVILFYVKDKSSFTFNKEYLPYPEGYRRRGGKKPTGKGFPIEDTWNCNEADVLNSIQIQSFSTEKTGYPTQKPLLLLERIIKASSNKGDIVLDPFCGCATTCVAAQRLERGWIGIDIEEQAAPVLVDRLSDNKQVFDPNRDFLHRLDVPQRTDIKVERPDKKGIKEQLYSDQNKICNGCKNEYQIKDLEIDHIVPRSRGGGDFYQNYQLLCGNCNKTKGDRPMEYLRMKIKATEEQLKMHMTFGT